MYDEWPHTIRKLANPSLCFPDSNQAVASPELCSWLSDRVSGYYMGSLQANGTVYLWENILPKNAEYDFSRNTENATGRLNSRWELLQVRLTLFENFHTACCCIHSFSVWGACRYVYIILCMP